MSSLDRLRAATETGVISADGIQAALGTIGLSAAEALTEADAIARNQEPTVDSFSGAYERTKAIVQQLYDERLSGNLETPAIEEFEKAGYNLEDLSTIYESMLKDGLQPEVVISPMLSRKGIVELSESMSNDRMLFAKIAGIVNCVTNDVVWNSYLYNSGCPILSKSAVTNETSHQWTLCVMSGAQSPQFTDHSYEDLLAIDQLPSAMQLVSLNLQRIQSAKPVVDVATQPFAGSWASGFDGITTAPVVCWVAGEQKIVIREDNINTHRSELGTRIAHWKLPRT